MLCVLVMRSVVRSLLSVDGRYVGETDLNRAITLPVSQDGPHYIGVAPLFGAHVPCVRKVEFYTGRLSCTEDDVTLLLWPDCAEIVLPAIRVPVYERAALLGTVERENASASLFRDCGVHLAIEIDGRHELSVTMSDNGGGELFDFGDTVAAVTEGKAAIASLTTGELLRLVDGDEFSLSGTELTAVTRLPTALMHEKVFQLDASGAVLQQSALPKRKPTNGMSAMLALLDALLFGFDHEIDGLLSGELAGLEVAELREFFGEFDLRVPHPFSNCTVGVKLRGEEELRAFSFEASELGGVWRVENAEPL